MSAYVPAVRPMSRVQIEQAAQRIIARHYPYLMRKPGQFPVLDFFDRLKDDYGLDPGVEELSDGVEGMTWPDGVIVSEETYQGAHDGIGRPRFTVVHEGFHGIEHRNQIRKALTDSGELVLYRRHDIEPFRDPEWQANAFAAAMLMPEPVVRALATREQRLFLTSTMMEEFGVSGQAAEVRLRKLAI